MFLGSGEQSVLTIESFEIFLKELSGLCGKKILPTSFLQYSKAMKKLTKMKFFTIVPCYWLN